MRNALTYKKVVVARPDTSPFLVAENLKVIGSEGAAFKVYVYSLFCCYLSFLSGKTSGKAIKIPATKHCWSLRAGTNVLCGGKSATAGACLVVIKLKVNFIRQQPRSPSIRVGRHWGAVSSGGKPGIPG